MAKAELARRKALLEAQRAKYKARYKRKLDALQNALDEYRTICETNMKDAQAREKEQAELKAMTSSSSILVAARFRPLMGRELKLGTGQVSDELVLEKTEGQEIVFRDNKFTMDYVFGMESQQELVFAPARSECHLYVVVYYSAVMSSTSPFVTGSLAHSYLFSQLINLTPLLPTIQAWCPLSPKGSTRLFLRMDRPGRGRRGLCLAMSTAYQTKALCRVLAGKYSSIRKKLRARA